jgi:hypothetical protein
VSPTAPTVATINDRLNKGHRRIRELEVHQTELLAQIGTTSAVSELTNRDARHAVELVETCNPTTRVPLPSHVALQRWESDGGAQPAARSRPQMQHAERKRRQ